MIFLRGTEAMKARGYEGKSQQLLGIPTLKSSCCFMDLKFCLVYVPDENCDAQLWPCPGFPRHLRGSASLIAITLPVLGTGTRLGLPNWEDSAP